MRKNCRIDVWMSEATAAKIEQLAREDDRPVSVMTLRLIEHSLAQIDAHRAAAMANGHQQQQPQEARP
ncbi:hypothetical protein [Bradyrhizobium sp. STM 3843]|uniref:hypothetical protein n=1 Tax=Bradyrhizobium sp. STM 3843 TaxID=551947 RepID=UPI00031FC71B|nr:hypothetical protein [Bradyrhizobium sp. STM 3843]